MMRRDLTVTGLVALAVLATLPGYERVFEDPAWRAPTLVAAGLALVLAAALRRVWGGVLVSALISAAALVAAVPWLLDVSARPVLPGPEALGTVRDLLALGWTELEESPAPAPASAGLVLLTVGGWWIVTHVAHELAVRWRREGAAAVAITVLWAAPLAIPMGEPGTWTLLVPFLVAAGLLVLAGGDDTSSRESDPPRLSAAGLALGGVAIGLAVAAPWVLPGYQQDGWVTLGSGASPRGYQPIVDVSNRLGRPEERDVLRVRASERTYLRLAGLDGFDGSTWRLGPPGEGSYQPDPSTLFAATDLLPPEEPASATSTVEVDVEVLELENIYVPLPYQPVEVLGPLRSDMVWSTEGGFLATWDTVDTDTGPTVGIREGASYRVRAARPDPSFDELVEVDFDDAALERHTQLPRSYPELGQQAEAVYAAAEADSVVEQALALQDWFVGPDGDFTYDLGVPALRGDEALTTFVLEDRVGYCEYFATAMAVMLRETGIPARVAVGFLPGRVTDEPDGDGGGELTEFTVSTGDAHAWVEVLFPGYGWITFEPTPRSDDTHILPRAQDLAPSENEAERREREREEQGEEFDAEGPEIDAQVPDIDPQLGPDDPASQGGQTDAAAGGADEPGVAGWLVATLTLGLAAVAAVLLGRRRTQDEASPRGRVLTAQRRLLRTAARSGVPRRPAETTPEVLERWHRERRIRREHAEVGTVVQAAAFDGALDDRDAEAAATAIAEAEALLRRSVPRKQRLLTPLRRTRRRTAELFGAVGPRRR